MLVTIKTFALYVTVAVSCCLTVAAQSAAPAPGISAAKTAPRIMSPEARAKMLAKTGGMIQSKAEGPALLFLNAQTRVPAGVMGEPVEPNDFQKAIWEEVKRK